MKFGPTEKTIVARKYRDKHGKGISTSSLARLMLKDNPLLFKDFEDARYVLRYIEGKVGSKKAQYVINSTHYMAEPRNSNPYQLPPSDEIPYITHDLVAKRVLVLSDIHIPYHSVEALTATFDFAKKEKPDCILLNGDTLDFFQLSKFVRDPKKRSFADELQMFKDFFLVLQKTFPQARIVFKTGNHEMRYESFLYTRGRELVGVDEFVLENIVKARALGVEFITDKRIINYHGLNIIHGHEFAGGFFSPVSPARGLFLRGKTSAIQGHLHQSSEHTEPDMNGKITTTWSTGCLCELRPQYMPINKWNHGFAIVDATGDGFEVRNKRIYKGKVL